MSPAIVTQLHHADESLHRVWTAWCAVIGE
jgi:hypothetical protein